MLPLRVALNARFARAVSTCSWQSCVRAALAEPTRYKLLRRHRYCSSCASPAAVPPASSPSKSPAPETNAPDHRDLGVKQELFTTSIYSPGSPIFLPSGTIIFNRLLDFLRREYVRYGFQEVITPTIYKKALWAKSGHLENYAEDMYTVTGTSKARTATPDATNPTIPASATDPTPPSGAPAPAEDVEDYGLKPMNCPGHCLIFASQRRSYRDLPIRYADFSPLHRNEISGALSGLTRVRRFHQDDGHVFCRPAQVESEIRSTLAFISRAYRVFGLGPYRLVLSTRPLDGQFIGSEADWDAAEAALARALDGSGRAWSVNAGDGAFYGPKIDVILTDSDGKEHQTATVQLDFQLPRRFSLEYQAPAPEYEARGESTTDEKLLGEYGPVRPVMIHRAVLGSVERLMALLIEHYDGRWPFWLNPRQVAVLTVNDTPEVLEFAERVRGVLRGTVAREDGVYRPTRIEVDVDDSARSIGLKVREARGKGYGAVVVVGPKDIAAGRIRADISGVPSLSVGSALGARHMEDTPEGILRALLDLVERRQ